MGSPGAASVDQSSAPRLRSIAAIVNPAAGGTHAGVEAELGALVADAGYPLSTYSVGDNDLEDLVRAAVSKDPDLLVVLAGDGTARLAAEICGPDGPLVAPLPGGTLNLLPHAIYGASTWQAALRTALEGGHERIVSGGRIRGQTFFVAAILGAPALWGGAREALRAGRLWEAERRAEVAIRRAFRGGVTFAAPGQRERTGEALALICPVISKALKEEAGLEMAALDYRNAGEMARLAFKGLTGAWREDPRVSTDLVQRGWARMRGSIPAILDGETHKLPRAAEFEFVRRAFRTLAPAARLS